MWKYLLVWAITASAQTAVIRGVVVENLTSKPLARTTVSLQPIAGTPGAPRQTKSNRTGAFVFDKLPAGTYVLKAVRLGFLPTEYGQKRWNSSGAPVALADGAGEFVNIRLLRYSAIRGTVVDENDVGLPDYEVVAYRNARPLEVAAQGTTDDRGAYRLHGLEPGAYYVRTAGKRYEDEIYRPTFGRESEEVDQARTFEITAEQDTDYADIHPFAGGRLHTLEVSTDGFSPKAAVTLTIASEFGRRSLNTTSFHYVDLPTGRYDLYAEAADPDAGGAIVAAYQRVMLNRDLSVSLVAQTGSSVSLAGGPQTDPGKLWVRRRDMAGAGAVFQAAVTRGAAVVPAGRWELMLQPPAGFYVADFSQWGGAPSTGRADGWNEVVTGGYSRWRFTVSSGPGAIRGLVKSGSEPVPGAPVFLEGYDPDKRARVVDLRTTRTDGHGQYSFADLAPGTYRILSTFEYLAPDLLTMDVAAAQQVVIAAHAELPLELQLYVIR